MNAELSKYIRAAEEQANRGDQILLTADIAIFLLRIAQAQERLVQIAEADLSEVVEAAIEERAEEKAQQLDADRTKRSFIGRK